LPSNEASTWYDLGCDLQLAQRHQEALAAFTQALEIDPNFPDLRNRIVRAYFFLEDYTEALKLSEALVRDTPRDRSAWTTLGATAYKCRAWDKSLKAAERAFELNPDDPWQLYNFFLVLREFGRFKRARHILNRAVSLDPENVKLRFELALQQLAQGDYENGWKTYESRWGMPGIWKESVDFYNGLAPGWRGESLSETILIIWPEQGRGDSLQFLRYLSPLAERAKREGGLIVLCCHESLSILYARSLADHSDELLVTTVPELPPFPEGCSPRVRQCPLMSLPLWLGEPIPSRFPYLTPDQAKAELWRERLKGDNSLKVGIAWTGSPDNPRNDLRSIPVLDLVKALKDIQSLSAARFYSLQLDQPEQAKAAGLIDFTPELDSFDDTAALVVNMDLVLAVDGAIAHLSGALGFATWMLADLNPHWPWQRQGTDTVWYKSVQIYRQQKMHDWTNVLEEIRSDFARRSFKQKV
jgi:Flp pilus assembly protein TadD